jgi:hypothetical protein
MIKCVLLIEKLEFLKTFTYHSELQSFLILQKLSEEISSNIYDSNFHIAS